MDRNLKLLAIDNLYYMDDKIKNKVDSIDTQTYHNLFNGDNPKYEWLTPFLKLQNNLMI